MRASILQPPNAHLLSEDIVHRAFPIHGNRNGFDTGGFTYGGSISCGDVDKRITGPLNQFLGRVVTGGVQSENVALTSPIKDNWKRVQVAGSSGAKTNHDAEPSTKGMNGMSNCAIIARFLELGGCITRKQLRAARRQYIKKPVDLIFLLDKDIRDLCAETETLERQRALSSVTFTANDVWSTAVEYFCLVRFGLPHSGNLLGFVREAMAPDVVFNAEYGPGAIVQYWCFAKWFGDVNVEVQGWERSAEGSQVAFTTTSVTITKQTLRNVFPHLRTTDNSDRNSKLTDKLLNQRLVMRGSTCFDWDNSTHRVTRAITQSDMLTPMLQLVGNLEDASLVFDKAIISPEFQWTQIMY